MRYIWTLILTLLGMAGGQGKKYLRRIALPIVAALTTKQLYLLLYIPILAIGYGQNSVLMGFLGGDSLVRVVYAVLLSIPLVFRGKWVIPTICLIAAFQVRAGSLGHFGDFDILIEDIVRYGTLSFFILKK